jgi:cytochrome d ubiquinol oxidase subunit I
MALALLALVRGHLERARSLLWALVLAVPLPYIANTAGWMTAEVGRQPWLVYGLMRTAAGTSQRVSAGNGLFSLLGFMGLYALLSIAFVLIMTKEIAKGISSETSPHLGAVYPAPGAEAAE